MRIAQLHEHLQARVRRRAEVFFVHVDAFEDAAHLFGAKFGGPLTFELRQHLLDLVEVHAVGAVVCALRADFQFAAREFVGDDLRDFATSEASGPVLYTPPVCLPLRQEWQLYPVH